MIDSVAVLKSGELCGEDRCRVMDAEGGCVCAVAAAEIERLREALTQIAGHYDRIYYPGELSFEFAEIARAALKENGD